MRVDSEVHKLWNSFLTFALHECSYKSNDLFEYNLASAVKRWTQPQSFAEIVSFLILNPQVKKNPWDPTNSFTEHEQSLFDLWMRSLLTYFLESSTAFLSESSTNPLLSYSADGSMHVNWLHICSNLLAAMPYWWAK